MTTVHAPGSSRPDSLDPSPPRSLRGGPGCDAGPSQGVGLVLELASTRDDAGDHLPDAPAPSQPVSVGSPCETGSVAGDFSQGVSLGHRAAKNGHIVSVSRDEKRFRLVCTCGWRTPISAKRKTAFGMATEHAFEAAHGRIAPVERNARADTPEVMPRTVGGAG